MPYETCNSEGQCSIDIRLEDNPEKFQKLLEQTEQQWNVKDSNFLASTSRNALSILKKLYGHPSQL